MPVVRSIVRDAEKDNDRFMAILMGIIKSEPFQMRVEASGRELTNATKESMMFLTKKFIPRRTFLRGAGVAIGLPLLDSMVPAQTNLKNTAAAPVPRFLGIWHPHGAAPGYWSPLQEGKNFDFSFITKPLEPFRNRVTLISGMDMPEAAATTEEPGGDHARGAVLLSSCSPTQKRGKSVSWGHGRPTDRAEVWPRHHPVVAPTGRRGGRQLRELQLGI